MTCVLLLRVFTKDSFVKHVSSARELTCRNISIQSHGRTTQLCRNFESFSRLLTSSQRVLSAEINFRAIGESEHNNRVEYYILKNPSVKPPQHRETSNLHRETDKKKGVRNREGEEISA